MSTVEFKPEWRLCHVAHCVCSLCGRAVKEEKVWRYFEAPARYVHNICAECASAVGTQIEQLRP